MTEIINPKDTETLKSNVLGLTKKIDDLTGNIGGLTVKIDEVVTAQEKVDASLQDFTTARRSGAPVQFMKADVVDRTIEDKLNSQLIKSKISIDVKTATIGKESKKKIDALVMSTDNLITTVNSLVESNKAIMPRKLLFNITIHDGKKAMWLGVGLAGLFLIGMIWAIVWANLKTNSIQEQAFYWGNRAYQASLLNDDEDPGRLYHVALSLFEEEPEKSKEFVDALEKRAKNYQEIKQYLLSFIGKIDSRDIRVITWEMDQDEGWYLYRFFDEETERSVHIWPDKKVEETTNKIVTNLASAQKYSKRKIWTVIQETPADLTK